jgi:hypothetical protein
MTQGSWFALRRELYAVTLDPYTLHEIKRGVLPAGMLVDNPEMVLKSAEASGLDHVMVRVRANQDAHAIDVAQVGVAALREALEVC